MKLFAVEKSWKNLFIEKENQILFKKEIKFVFKVEWNNYGQLSTHYHRITKHYL